MQRIGCGNYFPGMTGRPAGSLSPANHLHFLIETYFKLLKNHGQELEQWQQQTGEAIAKRILVASMACVAVVQIQNDSSESAKKNKRILIRLSGRQMKYGVESTPPALLAGYMVLLSMTDLLESPDVDIGELKRIAANALPFALV